MAPEGVDEVDFLHTKGSVIAQATVIVLLSFAFIFLFPAEAKPLPPMENVKLMSGVRKAKDKTFSTPTVICQDHTNPCIDSES